MRNLHKLGLLIAVSLLSQAVLVTAGDNSSSSGTHKNDKDKQTTPKPPPPKPSEDSTIIKIVKSIQTSFKPVRAGPPKEFQSNSEWLDISEAEKMDFCYTSSASLTLWHPKANRQDDKFTLQNAEKPLEANWKPGEQTFTWKNTDLPIVNGATYTLTTGDGISTSFTLHQVPENLLRSGAPEKALWMTKNGCVRQACVLLPNAQEVQQACHPKTN
jgi:hypothetical protein